MELLHILFYNPWFFFFWGAAWGSFLNVVMYRYPLGLSVVAPASACPKCKSDIAAYDNIPILSWFILRGKCRRCGEPFSIRYALHEALFATLCAGSVMLYPNAPMAGIGLSLVALSAYPMVFLLVRCKRSAWYLNLAFLLGCALYLFHIIRT